jgi:hypothetical protein
MALVGTPSQLNRLVGEYEHVSADHLCLDFTGNDPKLYALFVQEVMSTFYKNQLPLSSTWMYSLHLLEFTRRTLQTDKTFRAPHFDDATAVLHNKQDLVPLYACQHLTFDDHIASHIAIAPQY